MKNILLIYPEIPETYWSFKNALPFINKKASFPPLGLLTVAALIPDKFNLKLIDLNVETLDQQDISNSDMIFISAMIIQKESFKKVVNLCNQLEKPVIAGGPYPTSSYENIEGVDHFILNEAEITLPLFFNDLKSGNLEKVYASTCKPDIKQTPLPRYDLINVNLYSNMAVQFSRGCPFNCEFCDIIEMFGRKPRTKDIAQFITELDYIYSTGFRGSLFIVDDNFIGNKKEVKKLLPEIVKWQKEHYYPFTLFTEASINLGEDSELLNLMAAAAFDMVFLGIETPDAETLALSHKNQNAKSNMLESIQNIQKRGIEVTAGFIVGFDNDKESVFQSQVDFIQKSSIPLAMIGLMLALPNTQLYRRLKKENRLLEETTGNNTHDLQMNFIPVLPQNTILDGYKYILKTIYTPKNYFKRCYNLLKIFPKKRVFSTKVTFNDLRALWLSLLKQSFSRHGFEYLRFLIKTLFLNFRSFPEAVRMSIKGYHFFHITDTILEKETFRSTVKEYITDYKNHIFDIINNQKTNTNKQLKIISKQYLKEIKRAYRKSSRHLQKSFSVQITAFDNYCKEILHSYQNKDFFHQNDLLLINKKFNHLLSLV